LADTGVDAFGRLPPPRVEMPGMCWGLHGQLRTSWMPELTRPRKFQAKASEYPTIKGLGACLTGGSSQEPAARWRFESRPLPFVVVTFKVLGKAVLFSC